MLNRYFQIRCCFQFERVPVCRLYKIRSTLTEKSTIISDSSLTIPTYKSIFHKFGLLRFISSFILTLMVVNKHH